MLSANIKLISNLAQTVTLVLHVGALWFESGSGDGPPVYRGFSLSFRADGISSDSITIPSSYIFSSLVFT
jgi:hypothetical protein